MQEWKKYPPSILNRGSKCFWQKLIMQVDEEKIYANIVEWEWEGKKHYVLEIQIHRDISITGTTINVSGFNYKELNFNLIESHAEKIVKSLIK